MHYSGSYSRVAFSLRLKKPTVVVVNTEENHVTPGA